VLPLLIFVPLAGLFLLNVLFGGVVRKLALPFALLLCATQAAVMVFWSKSLLSISPTLDRIRVFGLDMDPTSDLALSRVLLLVIAIVAFVALLAGNSMFTSPRKRFQFINVLLLSMIGMNGLAVVQDLFSLYLFMEIVAVTSFVLIAFERERGGLEGAFQYIVMSAAASVMMLGAMAVILLLAGSMSFDAVARALKGSEHSVLAILAMGAFVCGLCVKSGLVPFHGWVPGAYSAAPAASSLLLAGIVTKASGLYGLIRLAHDVFPPSESLNGALLLLGAVTIIVGALAALNQTDMKRLLAYSSISQMGYIILGLGTGSPVGIAGAVFHLFNHGIFKGLLFTNSAALEQRTGTTDMTRMGGLSKRMPVTGVTSVIATLSTAGVPPFSGFWSKLLIIVALWQTGNHAYAIIALGFSVVTLAYLLAMQRKVFFGKVAEGMEQVCEATPGLVVGAIILAIITTGIGVLAPFLFKTFLLPIGGLL
jgi:proton-translocating NADH-quinone oxidoreductase chain M